MENGLPLLAVLFISGGTSKLADLIPVVSKKGADLAQTLFEAALMRGLIEEADLIAKTAGLTGDGAFAHLNAPFKQKLFELFGREIVIRWDLLHLINRAHIEARGKLDKDDLDEVFEVEDTDEIPAAENIATADYIRELIRYIQKSAKTYRHGLEYAKLKLITHGSFKRPKVWSSTRMVVYEFDMVERFLENSIYLDIALKYLLLALCHCLVMFALKIVLKNVQRVDLEHSYVESVIVGGVGKEAMKLAAQVAVDLHLNNSIDYLKTDAELIAKTNICQQSNSTTTFCNELYAYVTAEKRRQLFQVLEDPQERVTRGAPFTMEHAKRASDTYIELLWAAIEKRIATTDLSASPCAFSEAPAESVFSVYSRVNKVYVSPVFKINRCCCCCVD